MAPYCHNGRFVVSLPSLCYKAGVCAYNFNKWMKQNYPEGKKDTKRLRFRSSNQINLCSLHSEKELSWSGSFRCTRLSCFVLSCAEDFLLSVSCLSGSYFHCCNFVPEFVWWTSTGKGVNSLKTGKGKNTNALTCVHIHVLLNKNWTSCL